MDPVPSALIDSFIDTYVEALHDQNAAIFAGAGLSIPAGIVDWKGLLKNIALDIGLDVKKEEDLVTLAQFHVNERRGRHQINQALINEFANRASLTENHRLLAQLPIRTYWTTNYGPRIDVTTGSLDDPEVFPPIAHVWSSHKLGWVKLADELPCLEEGPPSE